MSGETEAQRSNWDESEHNCEAIGAAMSQEKRKLKIDLDELAQAFDDGSAEIGWFLDVQTGKVISIDYDTRRAAEKAMKYLDCPEDADDSVVIEALARAGYRGWMVDAALDAVRIESDSRMRYLQVPRRGSDEAFTDMEDFIDTVENTRLRARLESAIGGRRPFRHFKDELGYHDDERERWFAFRNDCERRRVLEWLEDEGIEPIAD